MSSNAMPTASSPNMGGPGGWDRLIQPSYCLDEDTDDFPMQNPLSVSSSPQLFSYTSQLFWDLPDYCMPELSVMTRPSSMEDTYTASTSLSTSSAAIKPGPKRRVSTGSASTSTRTASVSTTTSVFTPDTTKIKPPSNRATFSAVATAKQQTDRTERRRAQNRKSQHSYRARKEYQLRDATSRLDQLKQKLDDALATKGKLQDESSELRRHVSEVEARNDELGKQIHESQKSHQVMWSRFQDLWLKMSKEETSNGSKRSTYSKETSGQENYENI